MILKNIIYSLTIACFFFAGCKKKSVEVIGDYSNQTNALELIDNRTFTAVFDVNVMDAALPDNEYEYDLLLEVTNKFNVNDTYYFDTIYYQLGTFARENVSFRDTVRVKTDGQFTYYRAKLFFTKKNKKIQYTLAQHYWRCWGGTSEYSFNSPNNIKLRGVSLYPNVYSLDNYTSSFAGGSRNFELNKNVSIFPSFITDLNIDNVYFDDEKGSVYMEDESSTQKVWYFNKQTKLGTYICDRNDYRFGFRSGSSFYVLIKGVQTNIYKLFKFIDNPSSKSFVIDINISNNLVWPNYNISNLTVSNDDYYDVTVHDGKTYLYRNLISNPRTVYLFNEITSGWDLLSESSVFSNVDMGQAVFVQSGEELFICSSSVDSKVNVYRIDSNGDIIYEGNFRNSSLHEFTVFVDDKGRYRTFSQVDGEIKL